MVENRRNRSKTDTPTHMCMTAHFTPTHMCMTAHFTPTHMYMTAHFTPTHMCMIAHFTPTHMCMTAHFPGLILALKKLYNNTPSNATLNAASDITYRPVIRGRWYRPLYFNNLIHFWDKVNIVYLVIIHFSDYCSNLVIIHFSDYCSNSGLFLRI